MALRFTMRHKEVQSHPVKSQSEHNSLVDTTQCSLGHIPMRVLLKGSAPRLDVGNAGKSSAQSGGYTGSDWSGNKCNNSLSLGFLEGSMVTQGARTSCCKTSLNLV